MSDAGVQEFQQPAHVDDQAAAEAAEKAHAHGWVEGAKLNYEEFTTAGQPAWASNAQVYEWTGDEGEVGPANAELEEQLFNSGLRAEAGSALEALDIEATLEGPKTYSPIVRVSL